MNNSCWTNHRQQVINDTSQGSIHLTSTDISCCYLFAYATFSWGKLQISRLQIQVQINGQSKYLLDMKTKGDNKNA